MFPPGRCWSLRRTGHQVADRSLPNQATTGNDPRNSAAPDPGKRQVRTKRERDADEIRVATVMKNSPQQKFSPPAVRPGRKNFSADVFFVLLDLGQQLLRLGADIDIVGAFGQRLDLFLDPFDGCKRRPCGIGGVEPASPARSRVPAWRNSRAAARNSPRSLLSSLPSSLEPSSRHQAQLTGGEIVEGQQAEDDDDDDEHDLLHGLPPCGSTNLRSDHCGTKLRALAMPKISGPWTLGRSSNNGCWAGEGPIYSCASLSRTTRSTSPPSRLTVTVTVSPAVRLSRANPSSPPERTGIPSTATMRSPSTHCPFRLR